MTLIQLVQLPQIQAKLPGYVTESLSHLSTNADYTITIASLRLEDVYRMTAVVSFLKDGDVTVFHENMYLAAAVRRRFLACVDRGMKVEKGFLFATYDKAIYEALCAGEPQVLNDLARSEHTTDADERFDNPYYFYFALALRMFAIRDTEGAAELIADFEEFRDGAVEGHSLLARGILEKNQKLFTKGLGLAVEQRKAEIANDENVFVGEQWLSVECLALARLGRPYGLKPGITDRLIPEELQGTPDVAFPDPDSILPPIPREFVELPEESDEDEE